MRIPSARSGRRTATRPGPGGCRYSPGGPTIRFRRRAPMMFWKEQTQRPLPQTIRSNGFGHSPLATEPSTTPRNKKICVVALLRCCVVALLRCCVVALLRCCVVTMVSSKSHRTASCKGFASKCRTPSKVVTIAKSRCKKIPEEISDYLECDEYVWRGVRRCLFGIISRNAIVFGLRRLEHGVV